MRLLIRPVVLSAPAGTSHHDGSGSVAKASVASTIAPMYAIYAIAEAERSDGYR